MKRYRRVLGIDTAGPYAAVGYHEEEGFEVERTAVGPFEHSRRVLVMIEAVLERAGRSLQEVDLIAVSEGPGSYTGLRLGAVAAKVLGWVANIPLVGVDALAVLAANATGQTIAAALPARRGEVYARVYRRTDLGMPEVLSPLLEGGREETAQKLTDRYGASRLVWVGPGWHDRWERAGKGDDPEENPERDRPKGAWVARIGRHRARRLGTTEPTAFVPRYRGWDPPER